MNKLKLVLNIHGVITLLAGFVLIFAPSAIPHTVDITISRQQNLLLYFLAASEFSIAFLSFAANKISDTKAKRIIIDSFIVFHFTTLLLEVVAYFHGETSYKIAFNTLLRIVICILFTYFRRTITDTNR